MEKHIVLTGGGTAGHVTPNIALIPALKEAGYKISYIGSYKGIEKELIQKEGIDYYSISSGKLRRQVTLKNVGDAFRVIRGMNQASRLLKKLKPDIVFSKGGYVSVPVIFMAKSAHIPIVIHESDLTPGLANKISIPKANIICCNFEKTLDYLPKNKSRLTGSPIREELFNGDEKKAMELTSLKKKKPVLMIMGGSLGALAINDVIHQNIEDIVKKYEVIHLCGTGKIKEDLIGINGYVQFEYVGEELSHLIKFADIVVSRAGANAICELLALRKPNILIPLTKAASRGDQILNANEFKEKGYSYVLQEENLDIDTLMTALTEIYENKDEYISNMKKSGIKNPINDFVKMFDELLEQG